MVRQDIKSMIDIYESLVNDTAECGHIISRVQNLDKLNGGQTATWISQACATHDPMSYCIEQFDAFTSTLGDGIHDIDDLKCGFRHFASKVIGLYCANVSLNATSQGAVLCQLVAENVLFASKDVVDDVVNGLTGSKENLKSKNSNRKSNPYASWDNMTHIRDNNKDRNAPVMDKNGICCLSDDNTYANRYIKTAILKSLNAKASHLDFDGYEVCHIWDEPKDCRYYASIMNLCLIPRAIAGLSDYNDEVKNMLRCEAYRRFGLKGPNGEVGTYMPYFSSIKWRT